MSQPYHFSSPLHHTASDVLYDVPRLTENTARYVLEDGFFTGGQLAGQSYRIAILNPNAGDAQACHILSETERDKQKRLGTENLKARSEGQIRNNMSFALHPPDAQRGGLVLGLYRGEDMGLLAVGGLLLRAEKGDGGRGQEYMACPIDKQIVLNMGITHPDYQGIGITSYLFPHRIHVAHAFGKAEFGGRTDIVTMVAGQDTKEFYQRKMGFTQNGDDFVLANVAEPNNRLATLGRNIADLTQQVAHKRPDIFTREIPLEALHANHKTVLQPSC